MGTFQKARKSQAKARVAIVGPAGSGKTWTALRMASHMGKRIALIDTEHGSASKYADKFSFDTLIMEKFSPRQYVEAIKSAEQSGYDVLIIDSLSHAWQGLGGALEMVDSAAGKYGGNRFAAWRDVTPEHNALVDAMLSASCHIIVTVRVKTHYDVQKDDRGKMTPVKVGLAPIQREGLEYEFDVVGDIDHQHVMTISKTRCSELDGETFRLPGEDVATIIIDWLSDGEPVVLASEDQKMVVCDLLRQLGFTTPDAQADALRKAKLPSIDAMTKEQAQDAIERLQKKVDAAPKKETQTKDAVPDAGNGEN
jgi:hypothetical protein